MSAESITLPKTESWANWERLVINGVYPLRRFLGGSDHSAVFLTEYKPEALAAAAIKFLPADPELTQAQLVQWGTAATLSHPNLVRLLDVGRCLVRGRAFIFVVMEHAEQTLAQILPKRALTPDEVLELLPPTLDVLAFLHRNYLVHGQLKPSNFLVVNDQLKLASDTIRPIGNSAASLRNSSYDPPELRESGSSAAGDVWGLGITLVEALTQRAPAWGDDRSATAALLTTIPPPFVDTVLRCLSRSPTNRPTIIELENQYKPGAPQSDPVAAPAEPVEAEMPAESPARERSNKGPLLVGALAIVLITSLAIWVGLPPFQRGEIESVETPAAPAVAELPHAGGATSQEVLPGAENAAAAAAAEPVTAAATGVSESTGDSSPAPAVGSQGGASPPQTALAHASASSAPAVTPPPTASSAPAPVVAPPVVASAALPPTTAANTSPPPGATPPEAAAPIHPSTASPTAVSGVLQQEMPNIPRAIQEKIRGHINVAVRVLVDRSGAVVGEFIENAGPSRYFARQAAEAAGKWQFVPVDEVGSRVWLLRFEFTRESATVRVSNAP